MSPMFVKPESEELTGAGAVEPAGLGAESSEVEAIEVEAAAAGLPLDDFKALWEALSRRPVDEILSVVAEQLSDAPDRRREVLTAWMAQTLGYSRVWRRQKTLVSEPLWDVLSAKGYAELSERGEEALAMIGRTMSPYRTYLHPMAALATLAIWRHSGREELVEEARLRLLGRALPDELAWLYEVVVVFERDERRASAGKEDGGGRALMELVELCLEGSYWELGALLSALMVLRLKGRRHSPTVENLVKACDKAAEVQPRERAQWLQVMADATLKGQLSFAWLERPLEAAVRLSVDDPPRQERLREYLSRRAFDADYARLETLYESWLGSLWREGSAAQTWLFAEVGRTARYNPARAQRVLELMAARRGRRRRGVGSRAYRVRLAVEELGLGEELDRLEAELIGLYVHNLALDSHAVQLVRRAGGRVDWSTNPYAGADDLSMYLVVSDYERAFDQLTCKFDGVTMSHADKHAAARVKYFVQRRLDPNRVHRLVQRVFTPVEWLGSGLSEIGLVRGAVERGMERFEAHVAAQDLRAEVVEEFVEAGVEVADFEAIAELPVERVFGMLRRRRKQRLLLGAVSGGVFGGLAPFSWGMLSLADVPVLLSIAADISSRFCWYFGFDPREHKDLPMEILAVALGGSRPSAVEPMLVRQNLNEYVLRKTLMVGAVAHGGLTQLAGRGLAQVVERQLGARAAQQAGEMAKRAVTRNLQRRAVEAAPSRALPVVGALLGASLNVALIYDLCEAAQAVLTDRFLERKYPEWVRHIGLEDDSESLAG
ncbi:hypothetical protein FRC98_19370 [Lujinxingia vulgaris]|uniref:Uncharacterized protein n=2 Tax=Lujinxingia vulgaris TaxID=2600176 RepID=A0A5C6WXM9_9DELT|nr:hypothetical protein FRC98_19370 [Lujinxingia vulgaris]